MIKVLGLGNILRGDDGIGPVIIQQLEDSKKSLSVQLCDAGSDAFTILDQLLGSEPVLIIDCARMGKKPGTVQKILVKDAKNLPDNLGMSLHGYSLADVWQIARSLGVENDLLVIGIEPDSIQFNSGLSEVVKKSIPIILQMVAEEAKKYAEKDSHH
jgi:hydrogenase maturation protease